MAVLDDNNARTAIYRQGGQQVSFGQLAADIRSFASRLGPQAPDGCAWIAVREKYWQVVSVLGCLHQRSAALPDIDGPPASFDVMAAACAPALVICDDRGAGVARWAAARQIPVHDPADGSVSLASRSLAAGADQDIVLRFFTSGTTGQSKCISLRLPQLLAAVRGVGRRLALTDTDTALSVAPLNHTLGLLTSVLTGLAAAGTVAFADPLRPRGLLDVITAVAPTWCAASPSTLQFLHRSVMSESLSWPGLRLLRSSSAPLAPVTRDRIEADLRVQVINAYVMTEAPGEIASEDLGDRDHRSAVGRPTLCEVQVRSSAGLAGPEGEIWIRGPNVAVPGPASRPADNAGWWPTGDTGRLDDGFLALTGRTDDVINQGGLKVWPREIEELALRHPDVAAAVAFPVPHDGLGQKVGLAVVPAPGHGVTRASVRGALMADLPREKWPSTIVICEEIPRNKRGKISRGELWRAFALDTS